MQRMTPLVTGETYDLYNRGANKSRIFTSSEDYERILLLLFLCNSDQPLNLRDILKSYQGRSFVDIFEDAEVRGDEANRLVDILAYCLMPNHYHLVVRQRSDDGTSSFIKKVGTAYAMYFNTKYEHSGTLFQGRFKSRHIDSEAYFRYIFAYVHLNPIDLVEPEWRLKSISDHGKIRNFLNQYSFSSFPDYSLAARPQASILCRGDMPEFLKDQNDLEDLLASFAKDRPL